MPARDPLCRDDDASYDEASALVRLRGHHLGVRLRDLQNRRAHRDRHQEHPDHRGRHQDADRIRPDAGHQGHRRDAGRDHRNAGRVHHRVRCRDADRHRAAAESAYPMPTLGERHRAAAGSDGPWASGGAGRRGPHLRDGWAACQQAAVRGDADRG